jgi:hypothetical protein
MLCVSWWVWVGDTAVYVDMAEATIDPGAFGTPEVR